MAIVTLLNDKTDLNSNEYKGMKSLVYLYFVFGAVTTIFALVLFVSSFGTYEGSLQSTPSSAKSSLIIVKNGPGKNNPPSSNTILEDFFHYIFA